MRRKSRPAGAGAPGPIGAPRSISRTLLRQLGLVRSHSRASSSKPGGENRFQKSAGPAHSLGRGAIDWAVQTHDAAERTDRIAFVGELECAGRLGGDGGAAGIVMLEDAGRRLGELADQPQRTVEVQQVVVGEFLSMAELRGRQVGSASAGST